VIYGLQNGQGEERRKLKRFYARKSIDGEGRAEVKEILDRLGARDFADDLAQQYYLRALAHLEATGLDSSSLAPLKQTISFLLERNF
jgi:geranylgeranyl pyrophosphate synthase